MTRPLLLLLLLLLPFIGVSSLTVSIDNTITVEYTIRVVFKNYRVQIGNNTIILNGEINGVLIARYIFENNNVTVLTHYKEYSLKGFNDPVARNFIVESIRAGSRRVFNLYEKPLNKHESFIMSGILKYYVHPGNLPIDPWIKQRVKYTILSGSKPLTITEYRYFKYIPGKGILSEAVIDASIKRGETLEKYYLSISIIPDRNPEYWLSMSSTENTLLVTTIFLLVTLYILSWRTRLTSSSAPSTS